MNRSGAAVVQALSGLGVEDAGDLLVVFDDLDLPLGRLRLRPSGGAGGHRGMQDIIARLGSRDFPRLRFGIGRPEAERDPVEYVLGSFSPAEEAAVGEGIERAVAALGCALREGVPVAMNRFNRLPDESDPVE